VTNSRVGMGNNGTGCFTTGTDVTLGTAQAGLALCGVLRAFAHDLINKHWLPAHKASCLHILCKTMCSLSSATSKHHQIKSSSFLLLTGTCQVFPYLQQLSNAAGMLFGWETVMTFVLVSVVYAVAIGEPSFGVMGPFAVGLALFAMVFAGKVAFYLFRHSFFHVSLQNDCF